MITSIRSFAVGAFAVILVVVTAWAFTTRSVGALTTDQTQLVQIANQTVANTNTTNTAYVSAMAIYGNYALVSWTDNQNSGGEFVASKSGGVWKAIFGSGGSYTSADIQSHGIDSTTANYLVSNLVPLQPSGDTANLAISGSSTHTATIVWCSAPPPQSSTKYSASTSTSYSITALPTTSDTAIDVTIAPTTGTSHISIYAPKVGLVADGYVSANTTGGVSYWSATSPSGGYTVAVGGTMSARAALCSFTNTGATTTYTDTSWSGNIYYH